jgi:hypothetical protein
LARDDHVEITPFAIGEDDRVASLDLAYSGGILSLVVDQDAFSACWGRP